MCRWCGIAQTRPGRCSYVCYCAYRAAPNPSETAGRAKLSLARMRAGMLTIAPVSKLALAKIVDFVLDEWADHSPLELPRLLTNPHGWSNRKSRKLLHSGSIPGSLHRHVGRKNGNACNVFSAARHFVTVTVLHATAIFVVKQRRRNERQVPGTRKRKEKKHIENI